MKSKGTWRAEAPYLSSRFDYLNRSSRPEAAKVRAVVEDFFSRYPIDTSASSLDR
jgi:hypothetical protein